MGICALFMMGWTFSTAQRIEVTLPAGYRWMPKEGINTVVAPGYGIHVSVGPATIGVQASSYWHLQNPGLEAADPKPYGFFQYLAYNYGSTSQLDFRLGNKRLGVLGFIGAEGPGYSGFLNHASFFAGYGAEVVLPLAKYEDTDVMLVVQGQRRAMGTLGLLEHLDVREGWDIRGKSNAVMVGLRFKIDPMAVRKRRIRDDMEKIQTAPTETTEEEEAS